MKRLKMWYRSTNIFVVRDDADITQFLIRKRSKSKYIYPGWLDLCFGGIITPNDIAKIDVSAKRVAEEEMGLPNLSSIRLPEGYRKRGILSKFTNLAPKFAFKHKFEDDELNAWVYTYYMPWNKDIEEFFDLKIKPQSKDIDMVQWMKQDEIQRRI